MSYRKTLWEPKLKVFLYNQGGILSVSTGVAPFPIGWGSATAASISGAYAYATGVPSTQAIIVDLLKNGVTIYTGGTNRPTINPGAHASQSPVAPAITALAFGDIITVNIAQVGTPSGAATAGTDLTIELLLSDLS